ncbi:VOC family protein [Mesorhizobium sp. B1-1-5]|uniref:VOC family protein n=1 Tax=Mesorhizobium sp. B1-1-5 TaxID=2589979 RepID=UPI0015E31CD1
MYFRFPPVSRTSRSAALLAAGGYHHHLAINTWESRGGSPPPEGSTRPPSHCLRLSDASRALRRLRAAGVQLIGASDHGGAEAIYLRDPDDNGVELYWDRPEKEWPRNADDSLKIVNCPLNVENLASDGSSVPPDGKG